MFPGTSKDGIKSFSCKKCGFSGDPSKIKGEIKTQREKKVMRVIEEHNDTLPKTNIECSECGNNEAYYVIRQTRAADEPSTRIYECVKCNHKWREY